MQPVRDSHFPWIWAAYRRGAFPGLEDGLTPAVWAEMMKSQAHALMQAGGDVFILMSRELPVGLVAVELNQMQAWPHVTWFPEATLRARMECAMKFLTVIATMINAVIVSEKQDVKFFERISRYGLIRQIGEGRGWLNGEDVMLFETVRHDQNT